ncbi:LAGLIDADG family homing endonuclease [Candidatus Kaiserbacteria bacterium]|nr:LAGLIDADG family homing endonuclease [Candidatus Kaiserbacteria bacterium]
MSSVLTKRFLEEMYVEKKLSTWAIEKRFGIPRSTVYVSLGRYGIAPRNLAQSHIQYKRSDFSGDLAEKAYLLGFAIGDLRVRRHNGGEKSDTISIACGSTKSAQIELISKLFSAYGRVWKGKPDKRGAMNVEAFVNRTFSFLLPEVREYGWCAERKKHFFAFLAGFTDAEGSFYLARNQARIAWGNYDKNVLTFIRDTLNKFGIQSPSVICDLLKGVVGSHGFPRNNNYCHLTCARKDVLGKIIVELKPYIRHGDKKRALRVIENNLIVRGVAL